MNYARIYLPFLFANVNGIGLDGGAWWAAVHGVAMHWQADSLPAEPSGKMGMVGVH